MVRNQEKIEGSTFNRLQSQVQSLTDQGQLTDTNQKLLATELKLKPPATME